MPRIIIQCDGCCEDFKVSDSYIDPLGDTVMVVEHCTNLDCYDCTGCEDVKELAKAKAEIKLLKEIDASIKEL